MNKSGSDGQKCSQKKSCDKPAEMGHHVRFRVHANKHKKQQPAQDATGNEPEGIETALH